MILIVGTDHFEKTGAERRQSYMHCTLLTIMQNKVLTREQKIKEWEEK